MGHGKDRIENNVVGWRWVAENRQNSCELCRAMHGKEFYKNPEPGQLSEKDMPRGPLHPNCRCHVEEIYDYRLALRDHKVQKGGGQGDGLRPILSTDDAGDGFVFLGLVWHNQERPFFSGGPAYGYWGGGYWLGGKATQDLEDDEMFAQYPEQERASMADEYLRKVKKHPEPCDDMDRAYQLHDFAYIKGRTRCDELYPNKKYGRDTIAWEKCNMAYEIKADKELVERLKALPDDVRAWGRQGLSESQEKYAKRYRAGATASFEGKIAVYEENQKPYLDKDRLK